MMELGNDIINDIYEANYTECTAVSSDVADTEFAMNPIRRATSECDNTLREAWIKAKYIDKAFVFPIEMLKHSERTRSNVLRDILFKDNSWLVRQTSRRKVKLSIDKTEKSATTDDSALGSELSVDSNRTNDFGSDNDSTDDSKSLGSKLKEEKCENFNSDMLLYKSITVYNIPVMCYALASGASKNWSNSMDLNRSPIHQAILSVSPIIYD